MTLNKRFYGKKDICEMFCLDAHELELCIKRKEILATKIQGGNVRFTQRAVRNFMKSWDPVKPAAQKLAKIPAKYLLDTPEPFEEPEPKKTSGKPVKAKRKKKKTREKA
jgi:hypothetical protein